MEKNIKTNNDNILNIKINKWISKSEKDLIHAKNSLKMNDYEWVLLACEQSAEKALKSVIIKRRLQLKKSHDLIFLSRTLKAPEEIITASAKLNSVYLPSRYPDAENYEDNITFENANNSIKITEEIL